MGTEGQAFGQEYSSVNAGLVLGGGVKFDVNRTVSINIEISTRFLFTDYLDDVSGKYPSYASLPGGSTGLAAALSDRSGEVGEKIGKPGYQRGQSPKKDDYVFGGITISYTIMKMRCPTPNGSYR